MMYHFTGSEEDAEKSGNIVTLQSFKTQMEHLKRFKYRVISMEEYEQIRLKKQPSRGKEVVLTFDDGNESYYTEFFPVLEKYQYPSTVFLVSESVKHRLHGSMSEEMVRVIMKSPLVTLGAHTKTHPHLTEVDDVKLKDELEQSKKDLEAMFGRPMKYFTYPFGALNEKVMKQTQDAGYSLAFTTSAKQLKQMKEGPFSLVRVKMNQACENPALFLLKASNLYGNFKRLRHSFKQTFL